MVVSYVLAIMGALDKVVGERGVNTTHVAEPTVVSSCKCPVQIIKQFCFIRDNSCEEIVLLQVSPVFLAT